MNIDFEWVLFLLVIISGGLVLLDKGYFAKQRSDDQTQPKLFEYSRSFFPILLIVFIIRAFMFEHFRIPSGSLEPTLLVNDFIAVNKFTYGLRVPITRQEIIAFNKPEIGDIIVFRWPPNDSFYYIKRLIGRPGDTIEYKDKVLTINGKVADQQFISYDVDSSGYRTWKVEKRSENLPNVEHNIYVRPNGYAQDFSVTVPEGFYFMLGDNRDDSGDSRFWGFVPERNIVGKASAITFSWDALKKKVRWGRLGNLIH